MSRAFCRWLAVGISGVASVAALSCVDARDISFVPADAEVDAAVDLQTDPHHCGRTNHDCLGGACAAGQCQPFTFSSAEGSPSRIVIDRDRVYWTDPYAVQIVQANKDGSGKVLIASTVGGWARTEPRELAVDEANVYFTYIEGPLVRCKIGGCDDNPEIVASDAVDVYWIVVDDHNLYWLEEHAGTTGVYAIDKHAAGGTKTTLATLPAVSDRLSEDAQSLFATSREGVVHRIPKKGGASEVVARAKSWTTGIVTDNANVYFTESGDPGVVYRVSKDALDANPTALAASQSAPAAVAVDPTNLYWVNASRAGGADNGSLMTCPLTACGVGVRWLASQLRTPFDVVVDDEAIYWVEADINVREGVPRHGAVKKLAKP